MAGEEYFIWLQLALSASNHKAWDILETYDDLKDFYTDCKRNHADIPGLNENERIALYKTDLDQALPILEKCYKHRVQVICYGDIRYPKRLLSIYNPPIVLYTLGNLGRIDDEVAVTVVGTRAETLYGKNASRKICTELAKAGVVIVSGLAVGCDTTAHEAALDCGGKTIGVLGCGYDVDYPKGSGKLKRRIMEHGAIISEFLPGTPPYGYNFPIRNRILAGLSQGTLITEAAEKSGALITARYANEQGRDIFAIPSSIFWKTGEGTLRLIQDGAKPVRSGLDILEEYIMLYPDKINVGLTENEKRNAVKNQKTVIYKESPLMVAQDIEQIKAMQFREQQPPLSQEALKKPKRHKPSLKKPQNNPQPLQSKKLDEQTIRAVLQQVDCGEDDAATAVCRAVLQGCQELNQITEMTEIPVMRVLQKITELEIKGVFISLPGSRFDINPECVKLLQE